MNLSTTLRRPPHFGAATLARPAAWASPAAGVAAVLVVAAGLRLWQLNGDGFYGVERLLAAAAGVATVFLAYELGNLLYSRTAGLVAALLLAAMPYQLAGTGPVLRDGLAALLGTLALVLVARFLTDGRREWLYGAGAAIGLAVVAKETSIVLLAAVYVFMALTPGRLVRPRELASSIGAMALAVALFALGAVLIGGGVIGGSDLERLLARGPSSDWLFYPETVPGAIGFPVLLAASIGLWSFRREASWRERLLVCWIVVPVVCLELLPVKGFHYLLPVAPPLAVLASRALVGWWSSLGVADGGRGFAHRGFGLFVVAVVGASLVVPTWARVGDGASNAHAAKRPPSGGSALMSIEVRDALLGFPIGSAVRIEDPKGRVQRRAMGPSAELTLTSLPRGEYHVSVEALGISGWRPVVVRGDRAVELTVISWLDVSIVVLGIASIALALLYVRPPNAPPGVH